MPHVDVPYPYGLLGSYPHMRPADVAIWEAFIRSHQHRFNQVWYDYHVGEAAPNSPDIPADLRFMWRDLTRWKCDVIARDATQFYAIEVKPHADAKGVGQALAYALLYALQHPTGEPITAVVLTDEISTTTAQFVGLLNLLFSYIHRTDPVHTEPVHRVKGVELWTPTLAKGKREAVVPLNDVQDEPGGEGEEDSEEHG